MFLKNRFYIKNQHLHVDADTLAERVSEYAQYCTEHGRTPSIEGFAVYYGTTSGFVRKIFQKNEDTQMVKRYFDDIVIDTTINNAKTGPGNLAPGIAFAHLRRHCPEGYLIENTQRIDINHKSVGLSLNVDLGKLSVEDLKSIGDLARKQLDVFDGEAKRVGNIDAEGECRVLGDSESISDTEREAL